MAIAAGSRSASESFVAVTTVAEVQVPYRTPVAVVVRVTLGVAVGVGVVLVLFLFGVACGFAVELGDRHLRRAFGPFGVGVGCGDLDELGDLVEGELPVGIDSRDRG
ncbi:MAG: hypothetical protein K1X95_14830 [Acidimicrobiia bacterium]|nr:hypothetical protein [Acidimicrobiia bacterium]